MAAPAGTQNTTTPFFGCKISLISKSEIRYEGILYTIDPKESTIALAKVKSFGSEDRPVERPVPPRDDIFEFIIFRASDIKDLIVDDPPPAPALSDPAIIQAQQHSSSTSFPSSFPQSSNAAAGPSVPQQSALQQLQQQAAQKAPMPKTNESQTDSAKSKPIGGLSVSSGQAFAKVAAGGAGVGQQKPRQPNAQFVNKQQSQQNQQQQPTLRQNQQQNQSQGQNGYVPRQQRQNNNAQNRVIGENANPNFHRNGPNAGGQPQQQQGFRPGFNPNRFGPRQHQMSGGGGFVRRGGFGGGHPGGMQHRNFVNRGPQGHHQNGPKFNPIPDGDFDFEKAQADFKILEEKLSALKLNGGLAGNADGGDGVDALPEVPGIPASAIAVAALEEEDISKEPCYNMKKSFFDSISCEALEREKGSNQRVDWKAERKMNRETFGVVSARRPTFYRSNQRGGFGGGGFRGGYHQQRGHYYNQNYRQNNQNRGGEGGGFNNPTNRVPRTPNTNGQLGSNNVSSTTPNNPRTPKASNGVGSSSSSAAPVAVESKN